MLRPTLLLAVLSLLLSCAPASTGQGQKGSIQLSECREPGIDGLLRCGSFEVPENPAAPEGRHIDLKIVVAPSERPATGAPVFFLAGGPGQGATETMTLALSFLREARERHDIVFVDIRGTGGSNKLACEPEEFKLADRLEFASDTGGLKECLEALDADPRFYNTPQFVDDLDAVRQAMGLEQINLYGGSYGTRLGLAYMAAHPERIRSAVLDGLAPYAMKMFLTFGSDGKVTLDRLFADCDADKACSEAFPNLAARFLPWLNSLDAALAEPTTITLTDPRTGEQVPDVPLDRAAIASAIRGLLYSVSGASLLPHALDAAMGGDYRPLVGQALLLGEHAGDAMATGLTLATTCAEDIARLTPDDLEQLRQEPFLGTSLVDMITESCQVWPHGTVPSSLFEPVASDIPVLLLSGAEDPVTPERWAQVAASTLTNATVVTLPAQGHIAATRGCADELIDEFFTEPGAEQRTDRSCLTDLARPPFFISATGPLP